MNSRDANDANDADWRWTLEGLPGAEALARLYSAAKPVRERVRAVVQASPKRRESAPASTSADYAPETPCGRLLDSDTIPDAMKDRLRALLGTLDPLGQLDFEIRAVQHASGLIWLLARRCIRFRKLDADLDGLLRSLAKAWRTGDVRPIHQPRKRPPRHWRTRQDPFETTWPHVVEWLEAEPYRTGSSTDCDRRTPGWIFPGQLRTLQSPRHATGTTWRPARLILADPIATPQRAAASPRTATDTHKVDPDTDPRIPVRRSA